MPIYSWIADAHFYGDEGSSLAELVGTAKKLLAERGYALDRIGVEKDVMPVSVLDSLRGALPGSAFIDISTTLMEQRVVKSTEEVDLLRTNGKIATVGTEVIMAAMAEGKSGTGNFQRGDGGDGSGAGRTISGTRKLWHPGYLCVRAQKFHPACRIHQQET